MNAGCDIQAHYGEGVCFGCHIPENPYEDSFWDADDWDDLLTREDEVNVE